MSWYSDKETPSKADLIRSGDWDEEIESNYEAITNMSVDELAQFFYNFVQDSDFCSVEDIKRWLRGCE